jgi:hypothetical protein
MSRRMSKVSAAAEKPRKQIERVVRVSARLAALAVLLDSLVSILIVDLARVRRRQDLVSVGYFDEFLACSIIASI